MSLLPFYSFSYTFPPPSLPPSLPGNVAPLSLLALNNTRLYVLTGSALVAAWGMIQVGREGGKEGGREGGREGGMQCDWRNHQDSIALFLFV